MKILKRLSLALLVIVAGVVGLYFAMAERVEVVVLHSQAADGERATRLWIVDDGGTAWLRTGAANDSWLPGLRATPAVELERGGETKPYQAIVIFEPTTVARVNQLMLEKYGWSENLLRATGSEQQGQVAIRLDPR
jgi:hypothetical protein